MKQNYFSDFLLLAAFLLFFTDDHIEITTKTKGNLSMAKRPQKTKPLVMRIIPNISIAIMSVRINNIPKSIINPQSLKVLSQFFLFL